MTSELKSNPTRDGISVKDGLVIIHQRLGKGDVSFPARSVTHVSTSRSLSDIPFVSGSLMIRCGSKKYVVRRMPKKARSEAVSAIQSAMAQ